MPYLLEDLEVNRVDLVDEGANSVAFIELFKRKEQSAMTVQDILNEMKPEHAEVINGAIAKAAEDLAKANEDLAKAQEDLATVTGERDEATQARDAVQGELDKANEDLANANSELETLRANEEAAKAAFDETETIKSMPQAARDMFEKMKAQKEAAEAEIRKAREEKEEAEAIAKAKEFKAIPVEQDKLVGIVKRADADLLDLLTVVNAAIEGTVLDEVGKSNSDKGTADAWSKIEAKADEVAKRDNITKAKAISVVIKESPELYREYLNGGAN
jgi:hypothetical protein